MFWRVKIVILLLIPSFVVFAAKEKQKLSKYCFAKTGYAKRVQSINMNLYDKIFPVFNNLGVVSLNSNERRPSANIEIGVGAYINKYIRMELSYLRHLSDNIFYNTFAPSDILMEVDFAGSAVPQYNWSGRYSSYAKWFGDTIVPRVNFNLDIKNITLFSGVGFGITRYRAQISDFVDGAINGNSVVYYKKILKIFWNAFGSVQYWLAL